MAAKDTNDNSHLLETDIADSNFCWGFVEGWSSMIDHSGYWFVENTANQRIARVFVEYVNDHGTSPNDRPRDVLMKALKEKGIIKTSRKR
jgi:glutamine synthetase